MENFVAFWKPDVATVYKKADAQKVAEEIYAVGDQPTREQIVEMARNKKTESHKLFDWDDKSAAEKYRLVQAGKLMTALCIEYVGMNEEKKPDTKPVPIRMYYNIDNGAGYTPTVAIMQNQNNYNKLLMKATDELKSFKVKYAMLKELQPVFTEIDKL